MKYFINLSAFCLLISLTITQAQDWTWMKGSSSANQAGVYGTFQSPDPANNPGARTGPASWVDNSGNLWLFGGDGLDISGNESGLNDLWMYNKTSGNWTWEKGGFVVQQPGLYGSQGIEDPGNTPGGRGWASSWKDNSGNLWLFGGDGYDNDIVHGGTNNYLNDLWKYDISSGNWTWMKGTQLGYQTGNHGTLGVEDPANTPGGRWKSSSWKDNAGNLWLFGGNGIDDIGILDSYNDLWKFNISTNNWTWMKGGSGVQQLGVYGTQGVEDGANTPGGRSGAVTWVDNSGNLWLFGGDGYDTNQSNDGIPNFLNDLWKYNISTNNWTWMKGNNASFQNGIYGSQGIEDAANTPGARFGAATWVDNSGNLWLLGGFGLDESGNEFEMSDLWKYNISSGNWTWIKGEASYSSTSFGIYGSQGVSDPGNNPGGREFPAYWKDNSTNNLWLFGGRGYDDHSTFGDPLNDLWKISGGILPVELQSFTASILNGSVKLSWSTVTEVNNYGFEVERLQDYKIERLQDLKQQWTKVGFVKGAGNSSSQKQYYFADNNLQTNDDYQYRLKQVDNDGTFSYSNVVEVKTLPSTFGLDQNYPNPFNPSTTIGYQLPSNSYVSLKIYDVLGKEVKTLVNEREDAGSYQINFNAEGLSSGVYIYQFKADKYTSTKTLMVLK